MQVQATAPGGTGVGRSTSLRGQQSTGKGFRGAGVLPPLLARCETWAAGVYSLKFGSSRQNDVRVSQGLSSHRKWQKRS